MVLVAMLKVFFTLVSTHTYLGKRMVKMRHHQRRLNEKG